MKHDVSNYILLAAKWMRSCILLMAKSPNPQSPSGYFNLPIQTMKAGALGTPQLPGAWPANNALPAASTSEIYGDPLVHRDQRITPATWTPLVARRLR